MSFVCTDTSREEVEESDESDSDEEEGCLLLPEDVSSDLEFLLALIRQCTFVSLVQFANMPLLYLLAQLGYTHCAYLVVVLGMLGSGAYQFWLRDQILIWLQKHKYWQMHVASVQQLLQPSCIPCLSVSSMAFLRGIYEAIDPPMDALTAGNSQQMHPGICGSRYSAKVEEAFEASWRGAPVVGQIIPSLGLPGVLTLILCVASFCQVYKLWSESRRLRLRIDTWDPSDGHEPKRRWQIWIRMSHLTDVGGLMLLHHLFKELVLIEVESSPDIWPIADRNASFEVKIFAESVPSLWFQISLFCLTFSDASFNNWLLTLISICTGTMTILHFLYLQTRVMLQLHRIGELWQIKETALIIAYVATLTSWVMCMVRLPGAWICPSHILNESGCVN
ncbi:unnamed protein product [Durusdinium trenchii]|uniref:Uncharacterized protein n=1 Tax=Durusdinium trenchii TaxID=1381693 RepID=A0ABP0NAE0_9DINO